MIHDLHRRLLEARGPNRELDCLLHEALTGQIDHRNDAYDRAHGRMLLDLGSERLVICIPEYTANFAAACALRAKDESIMVSVHSAHAIFMTGGCGECSVSLWVDDKDNVAQRSAYVADARSPALGVCVAWSKGD